MPNIYLYSGEADPDNIRLSDPTVPRGGGAVITTTISETLLAPTQAITAQLVIPAVIVENLLKPSQTLTGDVTPPVSAVSFVVSENLLAPSQALTGDVNPPVSGVTFVVAEDMPAPNQWIQMFDGYDRTGTGAAGNWHDKPTFHDPGRGTRYIGQKPNIQRRVTQGAPPPRQGITASVDNTRKGRGTSIAPAPYQVMRARVSTQGRRAQEEEDLLLLFMEVA